MFDIISKGKHFLSGVSMVSFHDTMTEEYLDGILLTIDGINYIAYTDPNDGWRSYGCFKETTMKQKFTFPKQVINVEVTKENGVDESGWSIDKEFMTFTNDNGDIILKIGTDYTDTWYPMAISEYYPQNLPINIGK